MLSLSSIQKPLGGHAMAAPSYVKHQIPGGKTRAKPNFGERENGLWNMGVGFGVGGSGNGRWGRRSLTNWSWNWWLGGWREWSERRQMGCAKFVRFFEDMACANFPLPCANFTLPRTTQSSPARIYPAQNTHDGFRPPNLTARNLPRQLLLSTLRRPFFFVFFWCGVCNRWLASAPAFSAYVEAISTRSEIGASIRAHASPTYIRK